MSRPPHRCELLVEGRTDEHFIGQFVVGLGRAVCWGGASPADDDLLVVAHGGVDALCARLLLYLDDSNRRAVGVIIDRDDPKRMAGQKDRWRSVADRLVAAGYAVTDLPADGLIVTHPSTLDRPTVGVWVMPNNEATGMLEDFAALLVPDGDRLLDHARRVVSALPERRFAAAHQAKAEIHTFLAWQADPGKALGQAIRDSVLSRDTKTGQAFANWLRRLFWPDADSPI